MLPQYVMSQVLAEEQARQRKSQERMAIHRTDLEMQPCEPGRFRRLLMASRATMNRIAGMGRSRPEIAEAKRLPIDVPI